MAKLKTLERLYLAATPVSDLSPLADLIELVTGATVNPDMGGVWVGGCPLADPVLRSLADTLNPQRTLQIIEHLRRQQGLLPIEAVRRSPFASPSSVPSQGPGPHFVVREDGIIDFAPPSDIDADGNNIALLKKLLPPLRGLARHVVDALGSGNIPHSRLRERARNYLALIECSLEAIQFTQLYVEGVRLQNAVDAADEKVREKELPSLDAPVREVLASLLRLHGTFMLSTAVGLELIGAEERYQRNPEAERDLRNVSIELASQLQDRTDIITPEAAAFVMESAREIGTSKNLERSAIIATGITKNVTIVLISGATVAVLALGVGFVTGIVGSAVTTLVGYEAVKKSKSFKVVIDMLTKGLDEAADGYFTESIAKRSHRLASHFKFILKIEPTLRHLSKRSQFEWLNNSLDWLKTHAKDDFDGTKQ